MATQHNFDGARVKSRHALTPLALSIVTLGIYGLYWYYTINREMRDLGEKVSPAISLLAITFGAILIVPPFVSLYNTADRIRRVQERTGITSPISALLALVMLFIPFVNVFQTAYMQSGLTRAYEHRTRPAPAAAVA